ncbi:MAG: endonuclease/exonuclease/phosphatase family protein [Vicinamibacterales bacterium]
MPRVLAAVSAVVLLATFGVSARPSPGEPDALRILTYNIHHGEGMDGVFDLYRVAEVVMAEWPDLVALQEVDQATQRSGGVRQANELSALTGLGVAFGKAMDYDGGEYGIAILSRWPMLHVENRPLPRADGMEPRTALTVEVAPPNSARHVLFTTTHLDQGRDAGNRLLQADHLNRLLAKTDTPSILAGDMNSRVDTDVIQTLRSLWNDMFVEPPADPAQRPRYRVDYVMARPAPRWRTVEARAIEAPGVSDHRPVLAVLELEPRD